METGTPPATGCSPDRRGMRPPGIRKQGRGLSLGLSRNPQLWYVVLPQVAPELCRTVTESAGESRRCLGRTDLTFLPQGLPPLFRSRKRSVPLPRGDRSIR